MRRKRVIVDNSNNPKSHLLNGDHLSKSGRNRRPRPGSEVGTYSTVPSDPRCSSSTPSSALVGTVVREIFPPNISGGDGRGGEGGEGGGASAVLKPQSSDNVENEGGESNNNNANNKNDDVPDVKNNEEDKKKTKDAGRAGKQQRQHGKKGESDEQPLFGYMIQSHLVEERKRARRKGEEAADGNAASASGDAIVGGGGGSKKKKNKKKKKKKASNTSTVDAGGAEVDGTSVEETKARATGESAGHGTDGGDDSNRKPSPKSVGSLQQPPSPSLGLEPLPSLEGEFCSSGCADGDTDKNFAFPPSSETAVVAVQPSPPPTRLDRLLDSLIINSPSSPETTGAARKVGESGSSRDLEAFSAFLRRKLEAHLEQQRQKNQQRKGDKSKSSHKGRGDEVDDSDDDNVLTGLEYKNVLPTILLNDVYDLIEKAECRICRTASREWLRGITTDDDEHSMEFCNTGLEVEYLDVEKNPDERRREQQQKKKKKKELRPLVLSVDSARVKRNKKGKRSIPGLTPGGVVKLNEIEDMFVYQQLLDDDDDDDDDYDDEYVDLEAGLGAGYTNEAEGGEVSFRLELRQISKATDEQRFLQLGTTPVVVPKDDEGERSCTQDFPMNTQDIIDLVKFILVPCGLELCDEKGGEVHSSCSGGDGRATLTASVCSLGEDELTDIAKQAVGSDLWVDTRSAIVTLGHRLVSLKEQLKTAEEQNTRSTLDLTTTNTLNKCVKECELLMQMIGDIFRRLFVSFAFAGWSSECGPGISDSILGSWSEYCDIVNDIIVNLVAEHQGKLMTMSQVGKNGIPAIHMSKLIRDSLLRVLNGTVPVLDTFVKKFSSSLMDKIQSDSLLFRLAALEAYRRHVEFPSKAAMPPEYLNDVFPDREMEDLFVELLATQFKLTQVNFGSSSTSADMMKKKIEGQRNDIDQLCKKVRSTLLKDRRLKEVGDDAKVQFLADRYEKYDDVWYDVEKLAKSGGDADVVDGRDAIIRAEGNSLAGGAKILAAKIAMLVPQWVILLTSRQYHGSSMEPSSLTLPAGLEKRLDETPVKKTPMKPPRSTSEEEIEKPCRGDGAERRVTSIISSLLYRWLEGRCFEWHAELTRDELLHSMDMEDLLQPDPDARDGSGNNGGGGGKKKKKKSKRKSGGGNNANRGDGKEYEKNGASQADATADTVGASADQDNSSDAAEKKEKSAIDDNGSGIVDMSSESKSFTDDEQKDGALKELEGAARREGCSNAISPTGVEEIGPREDNITVARSVPLPEEDDGGWKQKKSKRNKSGENKGQKKKEKIAVNNKTSKGKKNSLGVSEHKDSAVAPIVNKENKKGDAAGEVDDGNTGSQAVTKEKSRKDAKDGGTNDKRETGGPEQISSSSEKQQLPPHSKKVPADHPVSAQGTDDDDGKCQFIVGIIDGQDFISAETFLVKRLQVIMDSRKKMKKGRSSGGSTRRAPIVWL